MSCCVISYKAMDSNKKLSPLLSPIKSYIAGIRSMEQLPTDTNKSVLHSQSEKLLEIWSHHIKLKFGKWGQINLMEIKDRVSHCENSLL